MLHVVSQTQLHMLLQLWGAGNLHDIHELQSMAPCWNRGIYVCVCVCVDWKHT